MSIDYTENPEWINAIDVIRESIVERGGRKRSLAIKSNFLSFRPYPFATSVELFSALIKELSSAESPSSSTVDIDSNEPRDNVTSKRLAILPEILLIESEFSNISWSSVLANNPDLLRIIKENGVKLVRANREKKIKYTLDNGYELYLPQSWVEADIRLNLANCEVRTHHRQKFLYSAVVNIANIFYRKDEDFSFLSQQDFMSVLQFDYKNTIQDYEIISLELPQINIVDAREVGYSNEHSPFTKKKKHRIILFGSDGAEIDRQLSALLMV